MEGCLDSSQKGVFVKHAPVPTLLAAGVAGAAVLATLLPGIAQAAPAAAVAAAAPNPSAILISEIANGGGGADSNASRVSTDDFVEIGNYGSKPVDISGYRILRCGQTGDAYGPQKVVPAGTTLAPGDTYTIGNPAGNKSKVARDADYDANASTMHEFGYGAYIETPDYTVLDAIGFYHPSVDSDCERPTSLARPLDYRLNQSHQRVANTGNPENDFIVAGRTPDAPNATTAVDNLAPSTVKISEVANGSATSTWSQYVELANYGTEPVDVSGWKLYRCGENGSAYNQNTGLPTGTVIQPGKTFLYAATSSTATVLPGVTVNARYATGMHWRDFGAMITRADDRIVDRVGFYENRNSICTAGTSQAENLSSMQAEAYHRISDTRDNATDFMLARERSPGTVSAKADLSKPAKAIRGDLRISEIVGAGPAGENDEFVEIGNYGTSDINLSGYSLARCDGDGRGNAGTQVPDLGNVTLKPGGVYVAKAAAAPADLKADATYAVNLNSADGYGMYLRNPQGAMVDAVGVYETVDYSPCVIGSELRNYTKNDKGESYQRARTTGDNEDDFMKMPQRTPGVLSDVRWVDPTKPLPGETDQVDVATEHVPGTPKAQATARADGFKATITTTDEDKDDLAVELRSATPIATEGTTIWAGSTTRKKPATLSVTGERRVTTAPKLSTKAGRDTYPFQRFAVPVAKVPAQGVEFTWSGTTRDRNDVQMYAWAGDEWTLLTERAPSADGDLTLVGSVPAASVVDGVANVLVIDGPRVTGGAVDQIGVSDQKFLDPQDYDFAFNHMTDTQFLSEGFRDVYRLMTTWVVANAKDRKIAYATNTGDIIENWINGNADEVRARKEFGDAKKIQQMLNDANIPNGVLPGNHDSFWGRNNDLFNEYFPPEMYENESWWGGAWKKGDNSAHFDFFENNGVDFLALSLPYRPSQAQIDWAREISESYPDHNVILLTHSYLTTEKEIENRGNRYTARGEELWKDLIAPSDNIFLVLGGHYHGVATKYGDPVTGEQSDAIEIAEDTVAVRNVGETGRTVVQMLADYQGYRSTQPAGRADTLDRDTGFQRLLQFDVDAELMAVNSYSPHLKSFEAYKYDEPGQRGTPDKDYQNGRYLAKDDEFVAKVDLLVAKDLATASWGVTAASTSLGTKTVASGAAASFDLPALPAGSVWFARVVDATKGEVVTRPAVVEIGTDPAEPTEPPVPEPGAAATTTDLWTSSTAQAYGAAASRLVTLSASVTSEGSGKAQGLVQFVDSGAVIGQANLANGVARMRLPKTLAVGEHRLSAVFVPADASAQATSSTAVALVRVTKAAVTVRSKLTDSSIKASQRGRVTVAVTSPGLRPSGRVTVQVTRDGRTRRVAGTVRAGKITLRLPKLKKGTYTVRSRFAGSSTVSPGSAPAVRLRIR
jgi:hypothetical protein